MPAEWEPHRSTWLAWPKNKETWPGKLLKEVESIYLQMITALLPYEKVNLLVDDQKTVKRILGALGKKRMPTQNIFFHEVKSADVWIRDYGPIFLKKMESVSGRQRSGKHKKTTDSCLPSTGYSRNNIAYTKWIFNAWGGKYPDLARDNGVVAKIGSLRKIKRFNPGIIFEGGSLDVNGCGTGLTTEQCLLNHNRNAGFSKETLEKYLKKFLGVAKIIWLKEGIDGDDTDGHVDDLARFVGPRTVLTAVENDPSDNNYAILKKNLDILKSASDQDGRRLRVVELPMPGRVVGGKGGSNRLPASYANFYIANKTVLVPLYGHRNDKLALKILQGVFSGRKAVGLDCTALVHGLGAIHCVTQQEPL